LSPNCALQVVFIEPDNGFFWVGCVYGRNDDAARFAFFNGVAQEYIARSGLNPDIVHCHDWQTAPAVFNGGAGKKVHPQNPFFQYPPYTFSEM
jgi:starch synthase